MKLRTIKTITLITACVLIFSFLIMGASCEEKINTVTLKAWAPNGGSPLRRENFFEAAEILNKQLEAAGANVRVKVECPVPGSWDAYTKANLLALGTGDPEKIADIMIIAPEDIGSFADAGYIISLDDYIAKYPETYTDIIPALWVPCEYKGKKWSVPQDTEVRMIYYHKDYLAKLGWSKDEIEKLPEKVFNGEFTLDDLVGLSEELINAGIVDKGHGFWFRPRPGADWYLYMLAYGGKLVNPETGNLFIDKAAYLKSFEFMKKVVDTGITMKGITSLDWPEWHQTVADGKVAFIQAGCYHWAEWQFRFGLDKEYAEENLGFFPIPAGVKGGKPVSVSHPMQATITSASLHKDLAFLLLTIYESVYLNSIHAVQSGHLAIRESQLSYPLYAEDEFYVEAAKISPISTMTPSMTGSGILQLTYFQFVEGVLAGQLTPAKAVELFTNQMKSQLGDVVEVAE